MKKCQKNRLKLKEQWEKLLNMKKWNEKQNINKMGRNVDKFEKQVLRSVRVEKINKKTYYI